MSKSNTNRVVVADLGKIIGVGVVLGLAGAIVASMSGIPSAASMSAASGTAGVIAAAIVNRRNTGHQ